MYLYSAFILPKKVSTSPLFFAYLLKKNSHQGHSKTLLLKSPPNTMRIKHIPSVFKNAQFIYIKRNKNDVYKSMQFLWEVNQKHYSFMSMSQKEVSKEIEETHQLFEEGFKGDDSSPL
ncbi:sulfotransferase [Crocinitomicaceae bacterium]|nr:sulfotransferase [Crocinitomicaceae bacterium]